MNTSYFANRSAKNPVAISRKKPPWFEGGHYPLLSPSKKLLEDYKYGGLSEEQYVTRFMTQLEKLDPRTVWDDLVSKYGENATLMCYEGKNKFCHRHIVAIWFQTHLGEKVTEL